MKFKNTTQISPIRTNEGGLTRRAILTSINSMLNHTARLLVNFFVTPIVIGGLGAELYGAWMMIQQTLGYLSLSDLRPMGTLKLTLGVRQHSNDIQEKRRQIGAAIQLWAYTLPVFLIIGIGAIYFAPFIIRTASEHVWGIRFAMAIMALGIGMERLFSLPANVLRGMNLDYKGMGLPALAVLLGGGLITFAILAGWGLPGLAVATILGIVISDGVRFLIVKRFLPWFSALRPTRKEFFSFIKLSGWLFLSSLGGLLLNATDILLVGLILGPSMAAIYTTTSIVLRFIIKPVIQLFASGNPGIAELCGRCDWRLVNKLRVELHIMAIGFMTVLGVGVIVLNASFLKLWVGDGFYGGNVTNLLLVLAAFEKTIFHIDGVIMNTLLEVKRKAFAMLGSGIFILTAGLWMCYFWGLAGMVLGIFLARFGLLVYLPMVIIRRTKFAKKEYFYSIFQPLCLACLLFVIAYISTPILHTSTWLSFGVTAIFIGGITSGLVWGLGMRRSEKKKISNRMHTMITGIKKVSLHDIF